MTSFFQNKFVRFALVGLSGMFLMVIIFWVIANLFTQSTGLSSDSMYTTSSGAPSIDRDFVMDMNNKVSYQEVGSSYYPPVPTPDGYTSGLETYETTSYNATARTKAFDALCDTLTSLKSDSAVHFKTLNTTPNRCSATFFVATEKVTSVLATLRAFSEVEIVQNTSSVTRHKQQLESQVQVLEQQLASVSRTLTATEIQFDEIATFARAENDAATLSKTIREKLSLTEQLTQQKINLTAQLNQLYQQAADLNERINVVEFSVTIDRAVPLIPNKYEREWDAAWEDLKDTFTDTLIGISTFFGIFLLWVIRLGLYLLVLIVLARGLWKFAKLVWSRW